MYVFKPQAYFQKFIYHLYSLTIVPPVDYLYIHNRMSVMLELIQYRFPFSLDAYSNMLQNAVPSTANTNKTLINEYHQTVGLNLHLWECLYIYRSNSQLN
jgi:hypothetical protein